MTGQNKEMNGLTSAEAKQLLQQHGKNELSPQKKESFFRKIIEVLSEPMFLLLIIASVIYFVLGEARDGAIMLIFVLAIISIDVIQEWKTDKTLDALKGLSEPFITVIRDDAEKEIPSSELVPGDLMMIHEGIKIPADGSVLKCSDLCVDESSLTGEAEGVWKIISEDSTTSADYWRKDYCYAGTFVTQGYGIIQVDKTGGNTEYGKIGSNVATAPELATPLQKQTGTLVKLCAGIAAVLFALVGVVTWFNIPDHSTGERLIESILAGITLAMAMIPEEFPVILTVFLSMGAWRLAKKQSLVRRLPSVETLGAVSVLCVDKTGTITMNKMAVQETWAYNNTEADLCEIMGLACETDAYDPMEKAMLEYCESNGISKEHIFSGSLLSEYPFTNELKMMGHIWRHDGEIIIAAKGSPERILELCELDIAQKTQIEEKIGAMAKQGLRVIAVGIMKPETEDLIPKEITDCRFTLKGLVGLADPPRESVKQNIAECVRAGIRVVMITGDNGITAAAIAKQIGMPDYDHIITGAMLDEMTDEELMQKARDVSIFSRVIPEHKMRIVKAFQANGEIVAMTGDGVNDAPALKHANIGIAMGKRGSEVSREAADLVLMDDNFSTIVDTVKDGRRIYDNIKKAIGYVFAIHIPIALTSLIAPMLGIDPINLFLLPLHVVLMEVIIDPTCSVVLERQPAESNIMSRHPRNPKEKLITAGMLIKNILQGLIIFAASFGIYFFTLNENPDNAALARTMGLVVIMLSSLFLVQVNSSEHDSVLTTIKLLARDKVMWAINLFTVFGILIILYSPLNSFLKLAPLSPLQLLIVLGLAFTAVFWYELVKLVKRRKS